MVFLLLLLIEQFWLHNWRICKRHLFNLLGKYTYTIIFFLIVYTFHFSYCICNTTLATIGQLSQENGDYNWADAKCYLHVEFQKSSKSSPPELSRANQTRVSHWI